MNYTFEPGSLYSDLRDLFQKHLPYHQLAPYELARRVLQDLEELEGDPPRTLLMFPSLKEAVLVANTLATDGLLRTGKCCYFDGTSCYTFMGAAQSTLGMGFDRIVVIDFYRWPKTSRTEEYLATLETRLLRNGKLVFFSGTIEDVSKL